MDEDQQLQEQHQKEISDAHLEERRRATALNAALHLIGDNVGLDQLDDLLNGTAKIERYLIGGTTTVDDMQDVVDGVGNVADTPDSYTGRPVGEN